MPASVRVLLAVSASAVLVFGALGCVLALWLELDGFGRERDTPVRAGYVAALVVGTCACLVSAGLLLPKGKRRWVVVPVIAMTVIAAVLLGFSSG